MIVPLSCVIEQKSKQNPKLATAAAATTTTIRRKAGESINMHQENVLPQGQRRIRAQAKVPAGDFR